MDDLYEFSGFSPSLETHHLVEREDTDVLASLENAVDNDATLSEFARNANMSSRRYDAYVYSLGFKQTGCYRKGALPVPLAANDTCLPGWYCECNLQGHAEIWRGC